MWQSTGKTCRLGVPRGGGGDAEGVDALAGPLSRALGGKALGLAAADAVVGRVHVVGEVGRCAEGRGGNNGLRIGP